MRGASPHPPSAIAAAPSATAGAGGRTALDGSHRKSEGLMPGTCSLIEDMYYCGKDCDLRDYDFEPMDADVRDGMCAGA